jgi:hypothetical protein
VPRPLADVLEDIERFTPGPDKSWLPFDALLREAFDAGGDQASAIVPLLRVFERFPRHDGYEVFWSVIHFLEHIGGYELALVESVQRCPTEMGLTMLRRLVNAGTTGVGDVELGPLIAWAKERAPKIDYM